MRVKKQRAKKSSKRRPIGNLKIGVLLLLVGGVFYVYEYANLEQLFHKWEKPQQETLPDKADTRKEDNATLPTGQHPTSDADASIAHLEIPIMKSRSGGQVMKKRGFTLSYSADYKTPQWVAWELTEQETVGEEGRANSFLSDPEIRGAKAYTADYTNSGYDRGHMAPAGDMKWSRESMEDSFLLSNVAPQNANLNRGDWKDLEEKSREWAAQYGTVYIACGPIYDHPNPVRIGNNKVAVPDAFYKVLLLNYPSNPKALAFLFDNKSGHKPLQRYLVTVDSVERRTHIDFFPALPDHLEESLEAVLHAELP